MEGVFRLQIYEIDGYAPCIVCYIIFRWCYIFLVLSHLSCIVTFWGFQAFLGFTKGWGDGGKWWDARKECSKTNIFDYNKYILLHSLALYGANSSGKSNLVSAMHTMARCVLLSVKLNDNEELEYDPFLLLEGNARPTMFEVIFLKGEFCYRYGFRYNQDRIVEEWLFRKTVPRSKEQMLFVRNEEGICVEESWNKS